MLVDTHAHLDGWEGAGELEALLVRAAGAGVGAIVTVGGDPARNEAALRMARAHPGRIAAAIGFDRDAAAAAADPAAVSALEEQARDPRVVAIGETGLDYHYGPDTRDEQRRVFARMAALARARGLPLVVHSREADADTLDALEAHAAARGGTERIGVLHCFTGDAALAMRLVARGLTLSFSGILTFANAGAIREAAAAVPEDRLLIETDAPYLSPVPFRGRRNEPARLVHTAEALARVRGCTVEEIAAITGRNALRLFGLKGRAGGEGESG